MFHFYVFFYLVLSTKKKSNEKCVLFYFNEDKSTETVDMGIKKCKKNAFYWVGPLRPSMYSKKILTALFLQFSNSTLFIASLQK